MDSSKEVRNPALHQLTGRVTEDGWTVGELVKMHSYQSGGNFSVGYLATRKDGRPGFFKALDFSRSRDDPDPVAALEREAGTYRFERDVLELCKGANLSRIVVAMTSGHFDVPEAPFGKVYYLIFELADGDARSRAHLSNYFDVAWSMRSLHHIATGLQQLHANGIFHQDVKPSNVLVFGKDEVSKIADLGRSHCKAINAPHDIMAIAGVMYYAPPDHLFNFHMPDRDKDRTAADLYLAGSMLHYFFMGTMMTPAVLDRLRPEHRPPIFAQDDGGWQGYFEDVLPYLREAYAAVVRDFESEIRRRALAEYPKLVGEVTALLTYLTEPDPRLRGHPGERALRYGNHYSLARFVSAFDRIASQCELAFKRTHAKAA